MLSLDLRLARSTKCRSLASARNFWPAFLQREETLFSKESLISILTPRSFSSLIFLTSNSPILAVVSVGFHVTVFEPFKQVVRN